MEEFKLPTPDYSHLPAPARVEAEAKGKGKGEATAYAAAELTTQLETSARQVSG